MLRVVFVEPNVLLAFIMNCPSFGDDVLEVLVQMLCARLYDRSTLDFVVLDRIGGISVICDVLERVRSVQAHQNLFLVILDWALSEVAQLKDVRVP